MTFREIELPDGSIAEFPADMPDDAIAEVLRKQFGSPRSPASQAPQAPAAPQSLPATVQQAAPQAPAMSWTDVPGQALSNLLPSAGKFVGGVYDALTSPLQTAQGVLDLGAGTLREGAKRILPEAAISYLDKLGGGEEGAKRSESVAFAAGKALKDRYGSAEAFKNTMATDPVGFASDVSLLTGLGATLAPGRAGSVLSATSAATNPVNAAIEAGRLAGNIPLVSKVASAVANAPGGVAAGLAGGWAGTGSTPIKEAYRAGAAGGEAAKVFRENLTGKSSGEAIVGAARDALGEIRQAASNAYKAESAGWKGARERVSFEPVRQSFNEVADSMRYKGKWTVDDAAQGTMLKIKGLLDEWEQSPRLHTVEGMDALKRRISGLGFDRINDPQSGRAITAVSNGIRNAIYDVSPKYAEAMSNASSRIRQIEDIQKTLSLGDKTGIDTSLRKLQSLMRNDVSSNYGHRVAAGRMLEEAGKSALFPALAGQSLGTMMPRGIQQLMTVPLSLGGVFVHPGVAASMVLQSPRVIGEAAYAAGRAANAAGRLRPAAGAIGQFAPALAPLGALRELQEGMNPNVRRAAPR